MGGYQLGLEAAAFAALPQPVWCIDAASRVLSTNPAFCALAGCTQDSASGLPWTQLLLPLAAAASDAAPVQRLQAAAAAGRPAQESVQCCSASGTLFSGQVSISPLPAVKCDGGPGPAFVCMLLGSPAQPTSSANGSLPVAARELPSLHTTTAAAAPAAPGSPQAVAVPPQLAQLCNQALASTSESVLIMDATRPGNPICWVNKSFERLTGERLVCKHGRTLLARPRGMPGMVVARRHCKACCSCTALQHRLATR